MPICASEQLLCVELLADPSSTSSFVFDCTSKSLFNYTKLFKYSTIQKCYVLSPIPSFIALKSKNPCRRSAFYFEYILFQILYVKQIRLNLSLGVLSAPAYCMIYIYI